MELVSENMSEFGDNIIQSTCICTSSILNEYLHSLNMNLHTLLNFLFVEAHDRRITSVNHLVLFEFPWMCSFSYAIEKKGYIVKDTTSWHVFAI